MLYTEGKILNLVEKSVRVNENESFYSLFKLPTHKNTHTYTSYAENLSRLDCKCTSRRFNAK